ncbi:MAG: hypothetical protein IJ131_05430, partial [Eggerthellaceae bacterium]|nr:hypothetical protein [Eggerthellaceae bacterium]
FASQASVLLMFPNFYTYALAMPLCTIAGNVVMSRVVDKAFPEVAAQGLRRETLGTKERADMRRRVAGLVVQKACIVVRDALPGILLARFAGLATVAAYGNSFVVRTGLLGVLGTLGSAMTGSVGNSVATESPDKNFSDMRLFAFLYAMVALVCTACLVACYQDFIALWVGDELVLPGEVAVLMGAYFYVRTMGDVRTVYVNATGVWWDLRWRACAETAANIALNVVLVQLVGPVGVVAATLAVLFTFNFLYGSHLDFKLYFGISHAAAYYVDHFVYLGACGVACAAALALCGLVPGSGLAALAAKAAVALLAALATEVLLFGRTRRFKDGVALAKRVVHR